MIGTREEWLAARRELLEQEKELTRRRDELARRRQELPWVAVDEDYDFETSDGIRTWSFPWVSSSGDFNVDFAVFTEEERERRTGFNFGSAGGAGVNVREMELHGLSAFALEDGVVYHTYSCYDRGTDALNSTWQLLDRTPKGRGEDLDRWPRRHDEYEEVTHVR